MKRSFFYTVCVFFPANLLMHLFQGDVFTQQFTQSSLDVVTAGLTSNRGFHVGDARLGGFRIFDARVKIQHDAQWSVLTQASIF